ncbi:MAG TPA: hypothetical protein VG710_14225 [Opitutus sp.]|nr:hypothetical protein [Opitutus sp.]
MNTTDPSDYAPLHAGPGLAIGLMLILGLRGAPRKPRPKRRRPDGDAAWLPPAMRVAALSRAGGEPAHAHDRQLHPVTG